MRLAHGDRVMTSNSSVVFSSPISLCRARNDPGFAVELRVDRIDLLVHDRQRLELILLLAVTWEPDEV